MGVASLGIEVSIDLPLPPVEVPQRCISLMGAIGGGPGWGLRVRPPAAHPAASDPGPGPRAKCRARKTLKGPESPTVELRTHPKIIFLIDIVANISAYADDHVFFEIRHLFVCVSHRIPAPWSHSKMIKFYIITNKTAYENDRIILEINIFRIHDIVFQLQGATQK